MSTLCRLISVGPLTETRRAIRRRGGPPTTRRTTAASSSDQPDTSRLATSPADSFSPGSSTAEAIDPSSCSRTAGSQSVNTNSRIRRRSRPAIPPDAPRRTIRTGVCRRQRKPMTRRRWRFCRVNPPAAPSGVSTFPVGPRWDRVRNGGDGRPDSRMPRPSVHRIPARHP